MDLTEELRRLAQLHANGALTDEEFSQAKTALLGAHETSAKSQMDTNSPIPVGEMASQSAADESVSDDSYNGPMTGAGSKERAGEPGELGGAAPASLWRRRLFGRLPVPVAAAIAVVAIAGAGAAVALNGGDLLTTDSHSAGPEVGRAKDDAAASATDEQTYNSDNELQFAQTAHNCTELETWYDYNAYDSNADIARQYWAECGAVPPPVLNFELEPWDNEKMFVALMEETFPEGNTGTTERLIPMGQNVCEAADLGLSRYEVQNMMTENGLSESNATDVLTVAITTLCTDHAVLITEPLEAPDRSDPQALAAELDIAMSDRFGDAYLSGSPKKLIRNARLTCRGLEGGYGSEVALFWVDYFASVDFNQMAEAAGMAVGVFCPQDSDLIVP